MPHTDYSQTQRRGMEGMVATAEPSVVRTGFNAGVTNIPIGRVLVQSGTGTDVALPSAAGQTVVGISVFGDTIEQDANGNFAFPPKYPVGRLVRGSVYMIAETALNPTSTLHYRHTANGTPGSFDAIGRVRAGADGVLTAALPNARCEQNVAAGEVFELVVNFT